jgi:hypothetical protein
MGNFGLCPQPCGGKIVQYDDFVPAPHNKAIFPYSRNFGRVIRPQFVQSFLFFFGVIGHWFLLRPRRYFLPHQRPDYCPGGGMFRFGASAEPCGGIVVYKDRVINAAGFSGVNPWRVPRYFFFQGPCFFFSHSWHWFLLRPRRYFLAHQLVDDFRGSGVAGRGFDTQPVGGKVIHHDNVISVLYKKAAFPVSGYFGRVPRYFFFQRPCFFFGHSCHWFLLLPKQMVINAPAFHSVKYVNSAFINIIIHNFKQIAASVIPNQQMFVEGGIPQIIISGMTDGMANIFSADPMPESGFVEFNKDFHHTPILPQKRHGGNKGSNRVCGEYTKDGGEPVVQDRRSNGVIINASR